MKLAAGQAEHPCCADAAVVIAVLELRARARARAAEEELCALGEERDRLAPQVEEARWHARRADKDAAAARAERDASGQARRRAARARPRLRRWAPRACSARQARRRTGRAANASEKACAPRRHQPSAHILCALCGS